MLRDRELRKQTQVPTASGRRQGNQWAWALNEHRALYCGHWFAVSRATCLEANLRARSSLNSRRDTWTLRVGPCIRVSPAPDPGYRFQAAAPESISVAARMPKTEHMSGTYESARTGTRSFGPESIQKMIPQFTHQLNQLFTLQFT